MKTIVPRINAHSPKSKNSGNDNSKAAFNEVLGHGHGYNVNRIKTPARCTLPLQTLDTTSRHITVIKGCVHITMGEDVIVLVPDESIYIPQGLLHGIENRANDSAEIISIDYSAA